MNENSPDVESALLGDDTGMLLNPFCFFCTRFSSVHNSSVHYQSPGLSPHDIQPDTIKPMQA